MCCVVGRLCFIFIFLFHFLFLHFIHPSLLFGSGKNRTPRWAHRGQKNNQYSTAGRTSIELHLPLLFPLLFPFLPPLLPPLAPLLLHLRRLGLLLFAYFTCPPTGAVRWTPLHWICRPALQFLTNKSMNNDGHCSYLISSPPRFCCTPTKLAIATNGR